MRLDHLLSKETSSNQVVACNVLRSEFSGRLEVALFNLEGIRCGAYKRRYGGIAQLGEHLPCKQGVIGSIPIISTILSVKLGLKCSAKNISICS